MTNEQAIQILKNMTSNQRIMTAEMYEAIDMAIGALQSGVLRNYEPILTEEERSEVLNAIDDALNGYQVDGYEDTDGMFFKVLISKVESCSEKPNRSDTIYRQDAIDACIRVRELRAYDEIEEIKALPSAQPEREILDELMAIMKEYYFTHRYEYNEAWENGFAKCMNLIPNVYMKRGKDR